MTTVSIEALLPDVLVHTPACPDPLALQAILAAATDFCDRSLIWREVQDAESIQRADMPLQMIAPAHGRVTRVLSASFSGTALHPATDDALRAALPTYETDAGVPTYYTLVDDETITLIPPPGERGNLVLHLAFAPRVGAKVLEKFLFTRWREVITSGTLRRLLAVPGQTWSNDRLAAYYATKFEQGVIAATADANRSLTRSSLSVAMRPLA